MAGTRDDPRVRDGFSSARELFDWAVRDAAGLSVEPEMLKQMAIVAYHDYEKTYPSKERLAAACVKAAALARKLTKKMSDEDVAIWIDRQWKKSEGPSFSDISVVDAGDKGAHDKVRRQNGILPVIVSSMDEPERMICHNRYGQSQLPNGQIVLQPVADAYVAAIVERRDRGYAVREARRASLANLASLARPKAEASAAPRSLEVRPILQEPPAAAAAAAARWRKLVRGAIRLNRADALANVDNAAEAEAQRKVREQANATNAAKQPRAYTTSGPSRKEGGAQWAEEPADAAGQAKEATRCSTSKEAQAQAIVDKRVAEKAATAHRLWQLEQIRKGEEIGGSK